MDSTDEGRKVEPGDAHCTLGTALGQNLTWRIGSRLSKQQKGPKSCLMTEGYSRSRTIDAEGLDVTLICAAGRVLSSLAQADPVKLRRDPILHWRPRCEFSFCSGLLINREEQPNPETMLSRKGPRAKLKYAETTYYRH